MWFMKTDSIYEFRINGLKHMFLSNAGGVLSRIDSTCMSHSRLNMMFKVVFYKENSFNFDKFILNKQRS